jgi:hypothetical protein
VDADQAHIVFQSLGRIEEALTELRGPTGRIAKLETEAKEIAPLVERHERVVVFGGWLAIPAVAVLTALMHGLLKKLLGW